MGSDTAFVELLAFLAVRLAFRGHPGVVPEARRAEAGGNQMRDRDAIDGELRLIAALRRSARFTREPLPANDRINRLLDERLDSSKGTRSDVGAARIDQLEDHC